MNAARSVTAQDIIRALKRRRAALPAEIGTFIIFEACEAMLSSAPLLVTLEAIEVSDEGVISVTDAERTTSEASARALHAALTSLLVAAGPAPTPALLRLVEEGPLEGRWTLDQMRDDLEAALVPLNRTASRRVLSRLVRETGWGDRAQGKAQKTPGFDQLDEELSSLLGVPHVPSSAPPPAPTPANAKDPTIRNDDQTRRDVVEPVDDADDDVGFIENSRDERLNAFARTASSSASMEPLASSPSAPRLREFAQMSERPTSLAPKGSGAWIGLGLIVLAAGLVAVTLLARPDALARLRGESPQKTPEQPLVLEPPAPKAGDLIVEVDAERAQVLRFVGRGPVTVEHLPLGIAHEFVAIADGAAATRVVVPRDAEWEKTKEGPRYELAMQAGATLKPGASVDLGETLLPQNVGSPRTELGSVRIVTTPRGAKVYQLIGFAPEARISDVPLDRPDELLIYKRGFEIVTRPVVPSDFVDENGRKVARIKVTLVPTSKR